ncbi:hypothetical protein H310_03588 [Aphanomyces invadans]|uniref:Uncharacterized protein n=1 Tax=Aphanomyces invadans TaxID=157072 RepID=A0A024UIG1_9STRA|nr:hypothetical protein H310_03588 [Aphanomyces invadans]ETW05955.1 hypothetical protein H310_03588 [Aphanomyces invadans]|eukprot:XP_008865732.1 hypothetical protein H310_03588 [Aphanomyces invadans]
MTLYEYNSTATSGRIVDATERHVVGHVQAEQNDDLDVHEPTDSDADDVEPEVRRDHILFEWSQILSSGSGTNQSDDDIEVEEILDHGQIQENVPNWPQEPTTANLMGLRGIKNH